MLTAPYVSAAAFRVHPTYLDLDGLVSSSDPDAQTAELVNVLLKASAWADETADQQLGAHLVVQNERTRINGRGQVLLHANNTPVIQVVGYGYGLAPTALTTIDSPQVWIEGGANLVITAGPTTGAWSGSLQFGSPAAGGEVFSQTVFVAGFVATQLAADATAGATQIVVADSTGIQPGERYRIWDPAREESVTVDPTWTAPTLAGTPTATVVPLIAPLRYDHGSDSDLSGMPASLRLAIINYATALLMRPDTTAEDEFPDTQLSPNTRSGDPRKSAVGLVAAARSTLANYMTVR